MRSAQGAAAYGTGLAKPSWHPQHPRCPQHPQCHPCPQHPPSATSLPADGRCEPAEAGPCGMLGTWARVSLPVNSDSWRCCSHLWHHLGCLLTYFEFHRSLQPSVVSSSTVHPLCSFPIPLADHRQSRAQLLGGSYTRVPTWPVLPLCLLDTQGCRGQSLTFPAASTNGGKT